MFRNPWFTLVIGVMLGLVFGYVFAERQPVPPNKALRPAAGTQGGALPEGHPPIDEAAAAETQRLQQQLTEIQGLLAQNPNDPGLMAAMGNTYFDGAMWDDARHWYERSLELQDHNPNVLTDLAVVYRNLQQPQRAIQLLDEAIAIHPDHWQAWYNKVVIFQFDTHEHDAAAEALRRVQELKESNPAIPDLSGLEAEVMGHEH